jgi:uncharacterized protein YukE
VPVQIDVKPTADPGRLKEQARELQRVAEDLDSGADLYVGGSASMTWRGQAAQGYEAYVKAYRGKLRTQASQLRTIASAMLKGAAEIETYRATIAKLRREIGHPSVASTGHH